MLCRNGIYLVALRLVLHFESHCIISWSLKLFLKLFRAEEEEDFGDDENGWKIIHTDVFRFPKLKSLFCAVIGVGSQLLAIGTGE